MSLIKAQKEWWSGRTSEKRFYYYERFICAGMESIGKGDFALLGYACDEGVKRNQGRAGAVDGPKAIREYFGKLVCHLPESINLIDVGDVTCNDGNLEDAHDLISKLVAEILNLGAKPLLIGGGHDLAYAHYRGLAKYLSERGASPILGVINLDAHFDLRAVTDQANSGTPFFQLSEEFEQFNYCCLGVRPEANDQDLFLYASQHGFEYLLSHECTWSNWQVVSQKLSQFIEQIDFVYLTIDLDGFSSAYAPGVSAPFPVGIAPDFARSVIEMVAKSGKLLSADVVELNPRYDQDGCTARLAAWLLDLLMQNQIGVNSN